MTQRSRKQAQTAAGAEESCRREVREEYEAFLFRKMQLGSNDGFDPLWMPDFLFDFQKALVEWALHKGRAAIFADCGLGKTPMQLVWAENVVRKTNGRVLILTPLAVGAQTVREGEKFGIECARSNDGRPAGKITISNYERLHHFNTEDFVGIVCDESSILKSFDGATRAAITEFMRMRPYRLLCTATAAPNDYIELGTSSEALGLLGHMDMLGRFFRNQQNNSSHRIMFRMRWSHKEPGKVWRFKHHAENPFWRWVCSWARAVRRPSDMGFDNDGFILPSLRERETIVKAHTRPPGFLFDLPAVGLHEQREERRRTIAERCEKVAELVNNTGKPAMVWCHLNAEGDLLNELIPDGEQVSGADSDDVKEGRFLDFAAKRLRVLITKPRIGAWGLNFQHCAHVVTFPSHSFEGYYQAVRRCWRFGQKRPVVVDVIASEGERDVMINLKRKAEAADTMFTRLVAHMNESLHIKGDELFDTETVVPSWL